MSSSLDNGLDSCQLLSCVIFLCLSLWKYNYNLDYWYTCILVLLLSLIWVGCQTDIRIMESNDVPLARAVPQSNKIALCHVNGNPTRANTRAALLWLMINTFGPRGNANSADKKCCPADFQFLSSGLPEFCVCVCVCFHLSNMLLLCRKRL